MPQLCQQNTNFSNFHSRRYGSSILGWLLERYSETPCAHYFFFTKWHPDVRIQMLNLTSYSYLAKTKSIHNQLLAIAVYTTLHYATLRYATLRYTAPHHRTTAQHSTTQHTTPHYTTLHYTTLHYTTLRYNALHCITMPHCAIQI